MNGQAHICAHDLLRARVRIFWSTRERASTPILLEDLKMCTRASTPMLSEYWNMCACARKPMLSHDLDKHAFFGAHARARKHNNSFRRLENVSDIQSFRMIGQSHICAHDLVRAHIFMSTHTRKHNNAFG
jgi:hypothetical protein